jgi:superfamily I DNA/RNA helicase/RecB family exonuclease
LGTTFHSFAYGLIREFSDPDTYAAPLKLVSVSEQDAMIRELLAGADWQWPAEFAQAVGTRGFAQELSALMARAQERGLGYQRLAHLAERSGRLDLAAAARFMREYDEVLAVQNLIDYPGVMAQAVTMAQSQSAQPRLRSRYRCVLVDEYQDTDPAQVALLKALQPQELIVVGDPHQSIYGFRGAQVRGIVDFPTEFCGADGSQAEVIVLGQNRRSKARIAHAAASVAARLPAPVGLSPEQRVVFDGPRLGSDTEPGRVQVHIYDSERAEAEHLADVIRRAHLEEGVSYGDIAILLRSGHHGIPRLRRSLLAAGVPVELAADDTPLGLEACLAPLLGGLHLAVEGGKWLDETRARGLLASPLIGLDATEIRALGKALRRVEREQTSLTGEAPRSSGVLLCEALLDAKRVTAWEHPAAEKVARFAGLVSNISQRISAGASPHEALWLLWQGTPWPERLRHTALLGDKAARIAHRDLDAVVALMDAAAKVERRTGLVGVGVFLAGLEAQQLPADSLSERGIRGDAVRMLTAHRAKGLQWRVVIVAGVNEEEWPDLRRRSSLLRPDELSREGLLPSAPATGDLLEERRLFYVAITRARERLLVTCVQSPDEDGPQPSRFVSELKVPPITITGRPLRPLSLPGLVSELRRTLADETKPWGLRQAAARRLRRLASVQTESGTALVAAASPDSWWGLNKMSLAEVPICEPIPTVSASSLGQLVECPAKWFFESRVGGRRLTTQAQGFGNVVHILAEQIGRGELATTTEAIAAALDQVDQVWGQLPFRTPWSSTQERQALADAVARFVQWHSREEARQLLAVEHRLVSLVTLPSGQQVRLYGYADRLELDAQGRVVVIDLKTSKYGGLSRGDDDNPQLGLYQLAVRHGAADDLLDATGEPGGAELVMLRQKIGGNQVKVVPQRPLAEMSEPAIERQLQDACDSLTNEKLWARPGGHCQRCEFALLCPAQVSGTVLS